MEAVDRVVLVIGRGMEGDRAAFAEEPAHTCRGDDRRVISGIIHVLTVGCRWCDCPVDYGPSTTIYNRFNRWSQRGFWVQLLAALVDAGVTTRSTAIDSTYIKIQCAAFGAKGALGASDRAVPGRLDHKDPCAHRRRRPPLRADADAGQYQRHQGCAVHSVRQAPSRSFLDAATGSEPFAMTNCDTAAATSLRMPSAA